MKCKNLQSCLHNYYSYYTRLFVYRDVSHETLQNLDVSFDSDHSIETIGFLQIEECTVTPSLVVKGILIFFFQKFESNSCW